MIRIALHPPAPGDPRWHAVVEIESTIVLHVIGTVSVVRVALATFLEEYLRDVER